MKKLFSFMLIIITIVGTVAMPVSAAQPADAESTIIMATDPRLNNGISYYVNFDITNTGLATVVAQYTGISGVTSRVTVTMSIEKKVSSSTWERVNIGTLTNSWVDSSTNISGVFSHTHQLKSTGTYRAVIVVKMFGSGGTADQIEEKIEQKYS